MGRIPLLMDTNCDLPYDFEIDYSDYGPIIDETPVEEIAAVLLRFHEQLSSRGFVELQRGCRELWEERLSPIGFFRNIKRHLEL